jgi:hypothetical protein
MTSGHSQSETELFFAALPPLVEMESQGFARLDRWMDRRLDVLETRWKHWAAPAARQAASRRAFGRLP